MLCFTDNINDTRLLVTTTYYSSQQHMTTAYDKLSRLLQVETSKRTEDA